MGLDAVIYCDCYEMGKLREAPPAGSHPVASEDGSLNTDTNDDEIQTAFDEWRRDRACDHEDGILVHHRIGNIAMVAALREELSGSGLTFPILLEDVLYSGTHSGDFIEQQRLELLSPEVDRLAEVRCIDPEMDSLMREFEEQMRELVDGGLRVRKPIAF